MILLQLASTAGVRNSYVVEHKCVLHIISSMSAVSELASVSANILAKLEE